MNRTLVALSFLLALSACAEPQVFAEFWRPISEPNTLMTPIKAQQKLDFDLSQCKCGIFPANVAQPELVEFQPDQQRMVETSVTITAEPGESCMQRPSLVVGECMRARGWEPTNCTGRMPLASGGALCAATAISSGVAE